MGDATGQAISSIMQDLLAHGHEFSFSQVMRIARMHLSVSTPLGAGSNQEMPEVPWQDRVRIRPELSLSFPAADVTKVEQTGDAGADILISTTFLALYGTSSPLPTHYTEDLLDEAMADSSVSRDFLDLLHQRLYHLYFQCWSKYRLFMRVAEEKNPQDLERLFCLIGLGQKELRESVPGAESLLRYSGLFSQFPRSALGLQTLLRDALGVRKLEVEQCVLRMVPIPADQQTSLGVGNNCLGVNTVLGSEMPDRMGKFRIHIGPLSKKEFDSFLPGTPRHDQLAGLIRLYILDPLDFDLKLILAAGEAEPIRLGDPDGPGLGWNCWCFSGATLGETSAIFPLALSATMTPAPAADSLSCLPETTAPSTLIDYYQQELARLHDLAAKYAEAHPGLATMVGSQLADPSVERLLEGVAFLNANLQQKLDDDFPELIQDVIHAIQPNDLRPVPATTIIVFAPKPNCIGTQTIPVGTELKSVPVCGTACTFATRYPVEIHPLIVTDVSFAQPPGKPAAIKLTLKLTGIRLEKWNLKSLRLFLAGESADASNLYLVLMRYLKKTVLAPMQDGESVTLDATHMKAVGFEETEALFPSPATGAAGQQIMQEYFTQPDKFLFIDLYGWEKWRRRGTGKEFEIQFELKALPFPLQEISKTDFALFATPAVNLFKHRAEPIVLERQEHNYPVIPEGGTREATEIYSVEQVTGLVDTTSEKIELVHSQDKPQYCSAPTYRTIRIPSVIDHRFDTFISVTPPCNDNLTRLNLDIQLLCSNGSLPEKLRIGDICKSADNSPAFATFNNCRPVKRSESVNTGNNALWIRYSSLHTNLGQLNVIGLRAILEQMSQSYNRDYSTIKLHSDRIQGIMKLQIQQTDRLLGTSMRRGWEIRITLNGLSYDSPGDLYLFGVMLDHFLRGFATESCFTRTTIEDAQNGRVYDWPVQMGRRCLL